MATPLKLLVSIANYGNSQLSYLQQVVREFQSYSPAFSVDIIVHSNIELPIEGITVKIIKDLPDWWELPFIARKVIYDKRNDYDLFIFNENDHLITQSNVEAFLDLSKSVPPEFIIGFFQYECGNGTRYFPAYHTPNQWRKNSAICFGSDVFARFTNHHQAGFIVTRQQLLKAVGNIDFAKENKFSRYKRADRVGADIYYLAGFTKLICLSRFSDILIHHLPDKYLTYGAPDKVIQEDIKRLLANHVRENSFSQRIYLWHARIERWIDQMLFSPCLTAKIRRDLDHLFKIKR